MGQYRDNDQLEDAPHFISPGLKPLNDMDKLNFENPIPNRSTGVFLKSLPSMQTSKTKYLQRFILGKGWDISTLHVGWN